MLFVAGAHGLCILHISAGWLFLIFISISPIFILLLFPFLIHLLHSFSLGN